MDIRTSREHISRLPDVFYRYIFKNGKIRKDKVVRNKRIDTIYVSNLFYLERKNGSRTYLSHAEKIRLGKYDGKRHAVFLEEDNAEAKAAAVFDMRYNERIAECEELVKDYILKRKTLYRIMRGEENGVGV